MGNTQTTQKVNFEDIQYVVKNPDMHILINTLSESKQDCLIPNTIPANQEEIIINRFIKSGNKEIRIILYGENANDEKIYKKYQQLTSLGFFNVYIYVGGMFEWLMLQDIYGFQEFQTTKKELDILRFKPNKKLNICMIDY